MHILSGIKFFFLALCTAFAALLAAAVFLLAPIAKKKPELLPVIEGYAVKEYLGMGSFGRVYLAMHIATGKTVALKVLGKTALFSERGSVEKLMAEVKNQKSLDHPNILGLLAWFQDDKNIYLVLEYAPGGDLYAKCLFWKDTISEGKVARILMQIAAALKECHDRGITHRDIKPVNILLDKEGNICMLADFGCSIMSAGTMDGLAGTMPYMAPEMLREPMTKAEEYTSKVDMWSLGVVAYGLFTAELPFAPPVNKFGYAAQLKSIENANRDAEKDIFERFGDLDVSDGAVDLLRKLLQTDPEKRISAKEVLEHPWIKHHKVRSIDEVVQHRSSFFVLCRLTHFQFVRSFCISAQISAQKQLCSSADEKGDAKQFWELLRSFLGQHHQSSEGLGGRERYHAVRGDQAQHEWQAHCPSDKQDGDAICRKDEREDGRVHLILRKRRDPHEAVPNFFVRNNVSCILCL